MQRIQGSKSGDRVLPIAHHVDDAKWIEQQIFMLPAHLRFETAQKYSKVWQEAHDAEPDIRFKDECARRAANIRLLRYVKAIKKKQA